MPKLISVAETKEPVRLKLKTVTRRKGWLHAKVGQVLQPVDRVMGFKKGITSMTPLEAE